GDGIRLQAGRRRAGGGSRRSQGAGSLFGRRRMSSMLEIADLHVAYGKVEAVRGVSLSLSQGQIITVIGPNGAGKTTLLSAAIGLKPRSARASTSSWNRPPPSKTRRPRAGNRPIAAHNSMVLPPPLGPPPGASRPYTRDSDTP